MGSEEEWRRTKPTAESATPKPAVVLAAPPTEALVGRWLVSPQTGAGHTRVDDWTLLPLPLPRGLTISFSDQIPVFSGNGIPFRNFGKFPKFR